MDQDRTVDRLRDELGLEIERVMAVDPAPELLVRVRARIDGERASHMRWGLWRLIGAGALGVAFVTAMIAAWPERKPDPALPGGPVVARPSIEAPPAGAAGVQTRLPPEPRIVRRGRTVGNARVSVQGTDRTAESAVLISPGDAVALRLLVASIREGRIDPTVLDDRQSVVTFLEPPMEIVIPPIAIEPVARLELIEGERQ